MKPWRRLLARATAGGPALLAARVLLVVWAAGLALTAWHLGQWRQELSRTLLQLNADAQFRARVASRDAVDPAWYRRKALSLLSAAERLQRDATWSTFIPGSWRVFDDLEEQVQARIEREFGDIVVETIRRELYARTSRLTGVPQLRGSAELQAGADCMSPIPQTLDRKLSAAAEDLPEFVAVADYVADVERLDEAMEAFLALQQNGGSPAQLRKLVAYALGAEVPGPLAGSLRLFHRPTEVDVQPALMQSRMQWATRCSLHKAMSALHARLLNTNDLFALEQGLAQRGAGLFEPGARPAPFDHQLERYRAVHALLEDQHALLAKGRNEWMRQGSLQLGPAYGELLRRIRGMRLLGPEVLQQLDAQSGAAFAAFRRQFEAAFGSGAAPGIVWLEAERRFGLSPERAALREGLGALLKAPFMTEQGAAAAPGQPARTASSLGEVVEQARQLALARAAFMAQTLPRFPPGAQPVVTRVVNARVSELVYDKAFRALKAQLPQDPATPLDPVRFRLQRQQVEQLEAVLKESGGHWLAQRLVATLDAELLRRLASMHEAWREQPLYGAGAFDQWQGEPLPLATRLGADGGSLARLAARLDVLGQRARTLAALGSPALPADPTAQRWETLRGELARYQARRDDSSLLRLERYLQAVGSDLQRENCAERLAAAAPPRGLADEIAQRHEQLHQALAARCGELRAQAAAAQAAQGQAVARPAAATGSAASPAVPMPLPPTLPPPVLLTP